MTLWQDSTQDHLRSTLERNEDILGLLLFGSCSQPEATPDEWSDIDLLVLVKNGKLAAFFPGIEWLAPFGKLYTFTQSSDPFKSTTRACFEDFSRIDFVITTEENLARVNEWSGVPFFSSRTLLFSRSDTLDEIASRGQFSDHSSPATEDRFQELVRHFRFKSMQAVYKVVRGDLLIALHLTQDLIRDCCVLGMMLRDRATGTNIHKHGGEGNLLVTQLERTQKPFTPLGILDSIRESNAVFEKLAMEWSSGYQANHLILGWIEKAKAQVDGQR